jgi:hypothetical protein
MVGLGLVSQNNYKNCKENVWLWKFVYHIEGHPTAHKYNLNPKKTLCPKINMSSNPGVFQKNSMD